MNQESLTQSIKGLFDNASNVIVQNVMSAAASGQLEINQQQLTKLVSIITSSQNQAFAQSATFFIKSIITSFEEKLAVANKKK